jgi:hypothetical protein
MKAVYPISNLTFGYLYTPSPDEIELPGTHSTFPQKITRYKMPVFHRIAYVFVVKTLQISCTDSDPNLSPSHHSLTWKLWCFGLLKKPVRANVDPRACNHFRCKRNALCMEVSSPLNMTANFNNMLFILGECILLRM